MLAIDAARSQFNPIYVLPIPPGSCLRYLQVCVCESQVGGGQVNAITRFICPTAINDTLNSTERDEAAVMEAQQDDASIFGRRAEVFAPGKAPETARAKLGKTGFEPSKKEVLGV